jgi:hypothetical protein
MKTTLTLPAKDIPLIAAWAVRARADCLKTSKDYEPFGDRAAERRKELDEIADAALRIYIECIRSKD